MSALYNTIAEVCEAKGISVYKLCKETGVRGSVMSDLNCDRKNSLSAKTLEKFSSYLGVTMDQLVKGVSRSELTQLTPRDERDIAQDLERILGDLEGSGDLMFDGVPMSADAIDSLRSAMKLGLDAVKMKNKETYTPRNYRK